MYMPPEEIHPAFDQFVQTIGVLRSPEGCPWDRAQTHESIAKNMLEEGVIGKNLLLANPNHA